MKSNSRFSPYQDPGIPQGKLQITPILPPVHHKENGPLQICVRVESGDIATENLEPQVNPHIGLLPKFRLQVSPTD